MRENFPESDGPDNFLRESDSKTRIAARKKNRFENKKRRSSADSERANRPDESIRGDSAFFRFFGQVQKVFKKASFGREPRAFSYICRPKKGIGNVVRGSIFRK